MKNSKIILKNHSILVLIVLTVICNSCIDPDDIEFKFGDTNYVDETFFSPPNWIIGKWEAAPINDSDEKVVFEFTSDNIIDPFYGDRNEVINLHRSLGLRANVDESKSDMMYNMTIYWGIDPYRYSFQKIDENTLFVKEGFVDGQIELKRTQ